MDKALNLHYICILIIVGNSVIGFAICAQLQETKAQK